MSAVSRTVLKCTAPTQTDTKSHGAVRSVVVAVAEEAHGVRLVGPQMLSEPPSTGAARSTNFPLFHTHFTFRCLSGQQLGTEGEE
jgi:hypothetical protein